MLCTGGRSASIVVTGTRDEAASYPQGISGCLISGEVLVTSVMGSRSWRSGGEGSGGEVGCVDDGVWEGGRGDGGGGGAWKQRHNNASNLWVQFCPGVPAVTRLTYRPCCCARRRGSRGSSATALPSVVREDSRGSSLTAPPSPRQPTSHILEAKQRTLLNESRYG